MPRASGSTAAYERILLTRKSCLTCRFLLVIIAISTSTCMTAADRVMGRTPGRMPRSAAHIGPDPGNSFQRAEAVTNALRDVPAVLSASGRRALWRGASDGYEAYLGEPPTAGAGSQ